MPIGCVTLEGYLTHRFIGDHEWSDVDVATIAAGLLADAGDTSDGSGIGLIVDAPTVGVMASRTYVNTDDQSVYDGLVELMDANLIEWMIDVDWRTGLGGRATDKIVRVRDRLGRAGDSQVWCSSPRPTRRSGRPIRRMCCGSQAYRSSGESNDFVPVDGLTQGYYSGTKRRLFALTAICSTVHIFLPRSGNPNVTS